MSATLAPASTGSCPDTGGPAGPAPLWVVVNLLLVAALFGGRLVQLAGVWWTDPNYSHGALVPLVAAWLAWRGAGRPGAGEVGPALAASVSGCLVHLVAVLIDSPLTDFVALALVLRGLAVAAGGRAWAARLTFPILFLFFMFPLPRLWTDATAVALQDVVARTSAAILDLFTTCHRQGNSLQLPGLRRPLVVAPECSGLRQIVAFLALAALVGAVARQPGWVRAALLVAAVPVAVVANVARVLLMAWGASRFGDAWLTGWLHDLPALLTLPLGLVLFGLLAWLLMCPSPDPAVKEPAPCAPTAA